MGCIVRGAKFRYGDGWRSVDGCDYLVRGALRTVTRIDAIIRPTSHEHLMNIA
jgi:hypothetical protein